MQSQQGKNKIFSGPGAFSSLVSGVLLLGLSMTLCAQPAPVSDLASTDLSIPDTELPNAPGWEIGAAAIIELTVHREHQRNRLRHQRWHRPHCRNHARIL